MADAVSTNNPAGEPPAAPSLEAEVFDILSLGDTSSLADDIAAGGVPPATVPPGGQPPVEAEPGAVPAAPGSETPPAPPEPAQTPAAPAPASVPPAPAASEPPAQPPAAPQPLPPINEEALRTASLQAQVAELTRQLEGLRANPQPAAPSGTAPAAEPGQPAGEQPFQYALTLPQQVKDALLSDNPEQNVLAINHIVNSLGTIVHHNAVAQMRKEVKDLLASVTSQVQTGETQSSQEQAREAGKQQYYSAFPTHNNALVEPLIRAESQKMAAEFPHLPWGPDYIAALGQRVEATIQQLAGTPAQPATTTPQPAPAAPPARPAAMLPSGQRGTVPTQSGNIGDEIVDILDPFSAG